MKVKVFEVSIDEKRSDADEARLNNFLTRVNVKKTSTQFINGAFNCWSVMVFYEEARTPDTFKMPPGDKDHPDVSEPAIKQVLSESQKATLEKLKAWRQKKASTASLPVFMICRNDELEQLVITNPQDLNGLKKIKGFGEQKCSKYGKELLSLLMNR